jgi:monothiol glutaredoxin
MSLPITVTDTAARAVRDAAETPERATLRLSISPSFEYDLRLDTLAEGDVAVVTGGITVLIDADSAPRADGLTLDFEPAGPDGEGGFTIDNPNAPAPIQQITASELKALIDSGQQFGLLDVRTPAERAIAAIDGSRLLDQALHDELMAGDRHAPLVFQCHHGIRSQAAAEHFRQAGFTRLYNLQGGIDAWSADVDPTVPRY